MPSRTRASAGALVALLALPALASAFVPTGLFTGSANRAAAGNDFRPRARLAVPLRKTMSSQGAARLVCNDGREAVKTADYQYLQERGACGVGFIASKKNQASHDIVSKASTALGCMEHRGACGGDYDSGDGSGMMTMIPWDLFTDYVKEADRKNTGVGMIFLPQNEAKAKRARETIEELAAEEGFEVLGWRKVPTSPNVLGPMAKSNCPVIEQVILKSKGGLVGDELEKGLYTIKRCFLSSLAEHGLDWVEDNVYICSLSSRTIIYKGMVRSVILAQFYNDLTNPEYKSRFAIYHRRFSTNTVPRWPLAQPFRTLGHNGEINTLLGNINWMQAREAVMDQTIAFPKGADLTHLDPLSDTRLSDSANLDLCAELLIRSGRSPMEALMMLVPEAYNNQPDLESRPEITDFYNYYSGLQEAWDGPALLVFSDGKSLGAALDRNGLRPARFLETDELVCMMSETGVVPHLDEAKIIHKGRLGPGQMISMDLESGEFLENYDVKAKVAKKYPYGKWLKEQQKVIPKMPMTGKRLWGDDEINLIRNQVSMGWSSEDMEMQIADMASTGKETTFCMGDDAPLAVLSDKPHVLYNYFKQRFAQVTNPAIDPLRENLVMSLSMTLGKKANIVDEPTAEKAALITIESPLMNEAEMDAMRTSGRKVETLPTFWKVADGPDGLSKAVKALQEAAEKAVRGGAEILVLSDFTPEAALKDQAYIPPLLAVGAVHHHLLAKKLRLEASIVAETGQAWGTHHIACLVGFGASAVHPYAALEAVRSWYSAPKTVTQMKGGKIPAISVEAALENYRESIDGGLFKIMSKIGISLLSSYHAAQIFEAIGLGKEVVDMGFPGTVSRVGGLNSQDLANEVISMHSTAFPETPLKSLENYGFVKYYTGREYHHNAPPLTKLLHAALKSKDIDQYKLFQESLKTAPLSVLRDLLEFKSDRQPIPIEQPDVKTNRGWLHLDEDNRAANSNGPVLDDDLLKVASVADAIENRKKIKHESPIINTDRSVGGRVAGVIAKKWGNKEFAKGGGELHMTFKGSAGQSFGAFNLPGMKMEVIGEVNDYVGKGMHGGIIVVRPPAESKRVEEQNTIVGNTALYGCTGGKLFAAGRAGERFCVRNSACQAVVEGAGDHALEYMTGGVVVMLGPTGRNVGAGMTGGIGYFLEEEEGYVAKRMNTEIVKVQRIKTAAGEAQLKGLLEEHAELTGSVKAKALLADWDASKGKFWQIVPPAEAKTAVASNVEASAPVAAA